MNFIQKKKKKQDEPTLSTINKNLEEAGLAIPFAFNKEHRQRAILFPILDVNSDGTLRFSEYFRILRYANIYDFMRSKVYNNNMEIDASALEKTVTLAHMMGSKDREKLSEMLEILKKGINFNFKQFVTFMQINEVFEKYIHDKKVLLNLNKTSLDQGLLNYIQIEDLSDGLSQLNLPFIKQIISNNAKIDNNKPVFD